MLRVVLSEHNLEVEEGHEQVFKVSKIFTYGFTYNTLDNDIMLMKVRMTEIRNAVQ